MDKVNGNSKADASNAGINSAKYSLFLCTDVDCILRKDTVAMLAKPFIENTEKVIATGATIRISNSCEFKDGELYKSHYPDNFFSCFQELEYIRAFIFGRMAWSRMNSLLLVSGGLGMFDKETVIKVGGYWHKSLGEDIELITRMRKYMHERKEHFLIKYIPETLMLDRSAEHYGIVPETAYTLGARTGTDLMAAQKNIFQSEIRQNRTVGVPVFCFI